MNNSRNMAVLLYDRVELLDFCGPYEVFSVANRIDMGQPFALFTVAPQAGRVKAANGLTVVADYGFADAPPADMLVVPGGQGSRQQMFNKALIDWLSDYQRPCEYVLSVCTGALILARCGLLNGIAAATHHSARQLLADSEPACQIQEQRVVDSGRLIFSGGISAGIDMALYVVEKLLGKTARLRVIDIMEYYHYSDDKTAREG